MDVARTSMMHAAAPHFLWPFAVRYAAHQINLHPKVSMPETSPALLWTGKDVTFDESVPYYRLFPYRTPSLPPPPHFLTQSSRSRLLVTLVLVRVLSLGVLTLGVLREWVLSLGVLSLGVLRLRVLSLGVLRLGVLRLELLSLGVVRLELQSLGVLSLELLEPGGAEPAAAGLARVASGGARPGGSPVASSRREPLSPQELREWFARRWRRTAGAGASLAAEGAGAARSRGVLALGVLELLGLRVRLESELLRVLALRLLLSVLAAILLRVLLVLLEVLELEVLLALVLPLGVLVLSLLPLFLPLPTRSRNSLRAASPTVTRLLATVVTNPSFESTTASALVVELVDFAARCRLDYAASLVAESASVCPPSVGDPDALDIPTPRSYAEAVEGPYSSQWQAGMDAEMASWKSTGTYVDAVPPPGANIVSGMWIFRVKGPPGSPPVFKARYVARGFSQRQGVDYFQTFSPTPKMTTLWVLLHIAAQREYELHSLDFSTAFLQGSLHEEIWLRRPPSFTGTFPPGTQWSLRRPVYGLRQAPREWHDTLRTTLAALGFAPSTANPSLFLRTDTSLPPFYILVYVDDLVFATADTAGLAHVKSELQKRHTCTDLGELRSYRGLQITRGRARRTITLTQSHMVQQVLQRFGFTYSSLLANV
ncbi:unnamed protein product [Closterium sp. NIES-64]|nr:unnamed protein product [Closterium sp. NIES-64]